MRVNLSLLALGQSKTLVVLTSCVNCAFIRSTEAFTEASFPKSDSKVLLSWEKERRITYTFGSTSYKFPFRYRDFWCSWQHMCWWVSISELASSRSKVDFTSGAQWQQMCWWVSISKLASSIHDKKQSTNPLWVWGVLPLTHTEWKANCWLGVSRLGVSRHTKRYVVTNCHWDTPMRIVGHTNRYVVNNSHWVSNSHCINFRWYDMLSK